MKKRLTAIVLSMAMALSLAASAYAFDQSDSSMGGGSTKSMTDEIYTEYVIIFEYLYGLGQTEKMEPYVMRLYDDYGFDLNIISEAFFLDYGFVEDVVTRHTEGRDPDMTNKAYEDWKHKYDSVIPLDESESENQDQTGENNIEGNQSEENKKPWEGSQVPPSDNTGNTTNPPAGNTNPYTGDNLNQINPLNPDAPKPTIVEDTATAEAQARKELLQNIIYAKISNSESDLKTHLEQMKKDGLTFEKLLELSGMGTEALETMLKGYGKDIGLLSDIVSAEFLEKFEVVPSESVSEVAPVTAPFVASSESALPTPSKVLIDDELVAFDAYNINGNNFFKLRDLAFVLTGTEKQFEVGWDAEESVISLTSGLPYSATGTEMTAKGSDTKTALTTPTRVFIDGAEVSFTAYNIDGNNYFKLRDIGGVFDFGIGWDADTSTITVYTDRPYEQ